MLVSRLEVGWFFSLGMWAGRLTLIRAFYIMSGWYERQQGRMEAFGSVPLSARLSSSLENTAASEVEPPEVSDGISDCASEANLSDISSVPSLGIDPDPVDRVIQRDIQQHMERMESERRAAEDACLNLLYLSPATSSLPLLLHFPKPPQDIADGFSWSQLQQGCLTRLPLTNIVFLFSILL